MDARDASTTQRPSATNADEFQAITPDLAIAPAVSVVVPTMNEAANIPHVFETIPDWVYEVILVDGHSTDGTVAVARRLRPDVKVIHQDGTGKGDAMAAGCAAATGGIIVLIDADGSTDGSEMQSFVSALAAGADFAKGSRFAHGGGSSDITLPRRLGNRVLDMLVNLIYGTHFTDLCYGYNAFWAKHRDAIVARLGRVRGRDPDEPARREGRAADPGDPEPRAEPHPRHEQPATLGATAGGC